VIQLDEFAFGEPDLDVANWIAASIENASSIEADA